MKSLKELTDKREDLKAEIIAIDKEIARHPEMIRSYFQIIPEWNKVEIETVASKVTFLKPVGGHTESRKNPVPWAGYVYEIDGKVYRLMKGDNWCSSLFVAGPLDHEEDLDYAIHDELWEKEINDPVSFLEGKGVKEIHQQVAYLLAEH